MPSFPGLQDYFDKQDMMFNADPWAILKTDKLAGYMMQVAVIGHKCDQFDVVQFLDEEDCILGVCWWCKTPIPENVQGIWKMLNWETLPRMTQYESEEEFEDLSPDERLVKNHPQVGLYTHAHNSTKTSCVRNPKAYKKGQCRVWDKNQTNIHRPMKDKTQTIIGRYSAP